MNVTMRLEFRAKFNSEMEDVPPLEGPTVPRRALDPAVDCPLGQVGAFVACRTADLGSGVAAQRRE